jgi:hypothetical protein
MYDEVRERLSNRFSYYRSLGNSIEESWRRAQYEIAPLHENLLLSQQVAVQQRIAQILDSILMQLTHGGKL